MTDELLKSFLEQKGMGGLYTHLKYFCSAWDMDSYSETLTEKLLTNLELKHEFAKYIVNQALSEQPQHIPWDIYDARLESFVNYYATVAILNKDLSKPQINALLKSSNIHDINQGIWLKGNIINGDDNALTPVRMTHGFEFLPVYRLFVVNTLCFLPKKFILGIRCDSGPVKYQQYHKGCKPIKGIRTDSQGRDWTIFEVDATKSDDFTALFSNALDGEGSLEICDYISDNDVRIIYRTNY